MQQFPDEEKRSVEVGRSLTEAFDLAEAMVNVWLTLEKDKCCLKSTLPSQTLLFAIALAVQACRLFRSVIEECKRCEAYSASILTRSIYETVLGDAFILARRLRIIVEPRGPAGTPGAAKFDAKASSKTATASQKRWLSREFRAKLYLAHSFFEQETRAIEKIGKFPGQKRHAAKLKKMVDPATVAHYENAIGPEWTYILRSSHSYSGLKVEPLTKVLHKELTRWYETIYHFQSRDTHGSNPLQHVDFTETTITAKWLSTDAQEYPVLRAAIGMFFAHMHLLHENIGFGTEADSALHSLRRKFKLLSFEGE
jgi:hypothetical protein